MKQIITLLIVSISASLALAAQPDWENICPDQKISYCKEIGKNAHNNETVTPPILQGIKVGKIIGVSWRTKGSAIEILEAIPSAGIPEFVTTSKQDAYYYIIDDGVNKPFLRLCNEIITR